MRRISVLLSTCASAASFAGPPAARPTERHAAPALSAPAAIFSEIQTSYQSLLLTAPLLTKALTSSTLFGVSDLLAQAGERKQRAATTGETIDRSDDRTRPDYRRVSRFMLTGLGSGVCWNYWFNFEQYITDMWTADLSGQTLAVARTTLGVVLEQFLMIPFCQLVGPNSSSF